MVYVSNGKASASAYGESASFTFDAKLINKASGSVIWEGSVDTSSWNGKSFMRDSKSNTLYDKQYASQLLTIFAEAMKKDGVI